MLLLSSSRNAISNYSVYLGLVKGLGLGEVIGDILGLTFRKIFFDCREFDFGEKLEAPLGLKR